MLEQLAGLCVRVGDVLLGWTLSLPRDLTLLIVALLSALIMVVVRPLVTRQELLRRCADDKKRLKALIREARARKDKPAIKRHRLTKAMVGAKAMRQEGLPFLLVVMPIALVWVWGFHRLTFQPPAGGQPFTVAARFPVSAAGNPVHLLPQGGIDLNGGDPAVKAIAPDGNEGVARWRVRAPARNQPYTLKIGYEGKTYAAPVLVGQPTYTPPITECDQRLTRIEVELPSVKLLGLLPAIKWLALPAWLVAYIVLAIPLMFLLKRLLHVR